MGFIETGSSAIILNRIYDCIALRKEGVTFVELMVYLDVLQNGTQEEKIDLCFRMIDTKKKGELTLEDFKSLLFSAMLMNEHSKNRVDADKKAQMMAVVLFQKFGKPEGDKVTLEEFKETVLGDPGLLEIFTLLNRGVTESIVTPNNEDGKLAFYINHAKFIVTSIRTIMRELDQPTSVRYKNKTPGLASSTLILSNQHQHAIQKFQSGFIGAQTLQANDFKEEAIKPSLSLEQPRKHKSLNRKASVNEMEGLLQMEVAQKMEEYFEFKSLLQSEKKQSLSSRVPSVFRPKLDLAEPAQELSKSQANFHTPHFDPSPQPFKDQDFSFAQNRPQPEPQKESSRRDEHLESGFLLDIPEEASVLSLRADNIREQMMPKNVSFFWLNAKLDDLSEKISQQDRLLKSANQLSQRNYQDGNGMVNKTPISELAERRDAHSNLPLNSLLDSMKTLHGADLGLRLPAHVFSDGASMDGHELLESGRSKDERLRRKLEEILELGDEVVKRLSQEIAEKANKKSAADQKKKMRRALVNIPKAVKNKESENNPVIFIFHKDWNLVVNIMIGINKAIRALWDVEEHTITDADYKMRDRFELTFNRGLQDSAESKQTISFFSYAPYIFADIRRLYHISNADFMNSIGSDSLISNLVRGELAAFRELFSTGKSGSFFYYSIDGKYVLKTLRADEYSFLKEILKDYHRHLKENPDTLIPKFFGLHKILYRSRGRCKKVTNIYLCIMDNIFGTDKSIQERYDLKGSTYKRTVEQKNIEAKLQDKFALKDNDFLERKRVPRMPAETVDRLNKQLQRDCEFFVRRGIIDYSLLLGIHEVSHNSLSQFDDGEPPADENPYFVSVKSADGHFVYFFGIIDILTTYRACSKKLEHFFKRLFQGPGISCIPPRPYAERFKAFMATNIFVAHPHKSSVGLQPLLAPQAPLDHP